MCGSVMGLYNEKLSSRKNHTQKSSYPTVEESRRRTKDTTNVKPMPSAWPPEPRTIRTLGQYVALALALAQKP